MFNNQEILRHGRVVQHAFVQREKVRLLRLAIGANSFYEQALSSQVHMSPAPSSPRHVFHATLEVHVVEPPSSVPEFFRRSFRLFTSLSVSRPCC